MTKSIAYSDLRFVDVWWYYANLVDYFHLALCLAATFVICAEWHHVAGALLLSAFLLDIVDGRVARAFDQCTLIGDGIDWVADLYVDVLLMVWWSSLEPPVKPWLIMATMIEISSALFDFAITATARYPARGPQRRFCVVLEWTMPGGRYTRLGWTMWMSYPFFVVVRCLLLAGASPPCLRTLFEVLQMALAGPAAFFVWSNAALLVSDVGRWTEQRRAK